MMETTFFAIFSANGILQWYGQAADKDAAWSAFLEDLGYSEDIPGLCEQNAYSFTEGAEAIQEVKDMGLLN